MVLTLDAVLAPVVGHLLDRFGRLIFGYIADHLTRQAAYTLNVAMTMVGVGALMVLSDPSQTWPLYV